MIRAVTFDLWGTLVLDSKEHELNLRKKRVELLYDAVDRAIPKETIAKALHESWSQIAKVRSTLQDVPTGEQVTLLQTLLTVNNPLEKPYTEAVLYEPPAINPYTKEVLSCLPVKIGLISNTGRTPGKVLRVLLTHLGMLDFFDATVFSNEVGWLKPHPTIFREASKQLSVPLSQMLHVGDDVTADYEGARNAGAQALLVKKPSDLLDVVELIS
jgi:putative hydrolase of the HAD superfamily